MKHLEEKILAYLDGSLADTEREEVLREVSASPEGRRMLEEHLRVGSLLTQAAKPTSAPLDAQRALASKLPMMAVYLPYLAPQSTRKPVGAWYRSTKYVTAMIGGAALIGGALWFALSNSNSSSESHRLPLAAEHGLVQPKNTQPQSATQSAEGNSTKTSSSSGLNGSNRLNGNLSTTSNASNTSAHRIAARKHAESQEPVIAQGRPALALATQEPTTLKSVEQTPAPKSENNASPNEALATPLHAVSISNAAAERDTHYEIPHFIAERQAVGYVPLRFFANFQERSSSLTDISPTKHIRDSALGYQGSDLTSAFEAELAYEVSPWVSVGLRGGQASFYRLQEHSYSVSSGDLTRTYNDAYLDRVSAGWLGASVRYEFNPEDKVCVAATGVGGAAFIPGATSPVASLELSGTYNIWSFLALEAAASVDGSRVTPSYQGIDANKPGVIGYITTGPERTTITTTAFGARIGLVFHP